MIQVLDFGDAPDKPYRTLLANDGARHAMPSALYLGAVAPDAESDGTPGPLAQGDDMTGGDDEDGVALVGALVRGSDATFRVVASAGGLLNAWIDFNQTGSWADAADQIVADGALAAGHQRSGHRCSVRRRAGRYLRALPLQQARPRCCPSAWPRTARW
jgi:hypothetical protein